MTTQNADHKPDQIRVLTACDMEELLRMGTLFRSLGLAVEDLAAAEGVLEKATTLGRGTVVSF